MLTNPIFLNLKSTIGMARLNDGVSGHAAQKLPVHTECLI